MRVYRLHLKTKAGQEGHKGGSREELVKLCLNEEKPFLAIGWSYLYENYTIKCFDNLLESHKAAYKKEKKKQEAPKTTALCLFGKLEKDDLIWTRDLDGIYYLCRVTGKPQHFDSEKDRLRLDIGATIEVEKLKVGLSVPGLIVRRFYSTNGRQPALQAINNENMINYSRMVYNELSRTNKYELTETEYDLFDMLDAWELEEFVIDYLQIKCNYYLSKNSVTRQDSTIKIECELFPRNSENKRSAVVQVKEKRDPKQPTDYYDNFYFKENKDVFLFYADEDYEGYKKEIRTISRKELLDFIKEYKNLLPYSIVKWCELCKI